MNQALTQHNDNPSIILTTLNARYIHSSLGLRYLMANMGELEKDTQLLEYNINSRPLDIAEDLISCLPEIIGFGVYIWNVEQTLKIIQLIKTIAPDIIIILGGPEVSYEHDKQDIIQYADYVINGTADIAFRETCETLLAGKKPFNKIIQPLPFKLEEIKLPYHYYNDIDVANRIIYVEASRGCPFKCEFCLSSLDKTVYPFDLDLFLQEMETLYQRGVRNFKFVDRTFNLKIDTSIKIMEFFLDKNDNDLFLHFELIPDHLPEKLKATIQRFPAHSLQFEIGIQSLDPNIQQLISRKQNNEKTRDNIQWLKQNSHAHIHADLIIGLPGEDIETFARGFNELIQINPDEIQVGILKRLRGTPIIRHTDEFNLIFNPQAPYTILSNRDIDFTTMQRLNRFARYWDIIINNGRFKNSKDLIFGDRPFENFLTLSDWIFKETAQTHKFSLERLFKLLYLGMTDCLNIETSSVEEKLLMDFKLSGIKGLPKFNLKHDKQASRQLQGSQRQQRHI
ncbi:MAG: B12-binding domain-containing radical SAM protein, partial [Gammaproteobacteria bacterium]|nr:B12-binding domain-containing radical SAM protein [Gammaproteobacteria bacterium]